MRLNQGWSREDSLKYHHATQGLAAIPYDIYLNLEAADSAALFRSDKVAESYGLIPEAADLAYNPDGLPIGVDHVKVVDGRWKGEWAGVTCAACHNGELHYKDQKISIEGGINTGFDFGAFIIGLDDALAATLANPDKFDRFEARLNVGDAAAKADLRRRFETTAAAFHSFVTRSMLAPSASGRAA